MNRSTEYNYLTHYRISDICVELLKQSVNEQWQDLVGAYGDYVYVYEASKEMIKITLPCYINELSAGTGVILVEGTSKRLFQKFEKYFLKKS